MKIQYLIFFFSGWLYSFFLWMMILSSSNGNNGKTCDSLYETDKDIWLKGETPPVSFPLQLVSVLSFAPIAFILQSNLLLSDLYTTSGKNLTIIDEEVYYKNLSSFQNHKNNRAVTPSTPTLSSIPNKEEEEKKTIRRNLKTKKTKHGSGSGSSSNVLKYYPIPFSSYFDHNHFIWYWSQHNLQVITNQFYTFCFDHDATSSTTIIEGGDGTGGPKMTTTVTTTSGAAPYKHGIVELKRIPDFQSYKNYEFNELLRKNKAPFPFKNHQLIIIKGKFKMIGLYNFWNNLDMLSYVYQSIRPSLPINKFIQAVLGILTNNFISIHLRVDEEAFPTSLLPPSAESKKKNEKVEVQEGTNAGGGSRGLATTATTSGNKNKTLSVMDYIRHSPCFDDLQHLNYELFLDPPPLYLMTNARSNSKIDKRKVKYLIEQLHSLGFENIYTRKRVVEKFMKKNKQVNLAFQQLQAGLRLHEILDDLLLFRTFTPEQLQYVDILISKSAVCFIPSQLPTITSYLIKRFLNIEKKNDEKYESINRHSYGNLATYREWGF